MRNIWQTLALHFLARLQRAMHRVPGAAGDITSLEVREENSLLRRRQRLPPLGRLQKASIFILNILVILIILVIIVILTILVNLSPTLQPEQLPETIAAAIEERGRRACRNERSRRARRSQRD